ICPQSNILFEDLIVEEHIKIFAGFKNIKEVELEGKRKEKIDNLSGGQKRKLCVAIALLGNPNYIFLDEPTSELDPLSRISIWNFLLNKKKEKVIFLTTHYMDEADIIVDRKLILTHGKIRCLGSNLYLKKHFNMNYKLNIETDHVEKIDKIIKNIIPESQYNENNEQKDKIENQYKCWELPINSALKFPELFDELDSTLGKENLKKHYGLSIATLEELFIKLDDSFKNNYNNKSENSNSDDTLPLMVQINENLDLLDLKNVQNNFKNKLYKLLTFPLIMFKSINITNKVDLNLKEISPKIYGNMNWNYDLENSKFESINKNLYERIIEKSVTEYSDSQLNDIGKVIDKEPYFVSSISGNKSNNNYEFNLYFNDNVKNYQEEIQKLEDFPVTLESNVKAQKINSKN
ncbi:hypothetical protein PIROE2DRAFT_9351, partial [Piromyces sp. E2]